MTLDPRIAELTDAQADLLGLLLDEAAGPPPHGPCLPERAEVRKATGDNTLVIIHGAGGSTLFLHQLARHMSPELGLVGIDAAFGSDHAPPAPEDADTLVNRYVAAVDTARQPGAPLHLGGYSSGCLIALEVARRIETSGDRVAALTLIDPAPLPASNALGQERSAPRNLLARRFETARRAGITPISRIYPTVARVQQVISTLVEVLQPGPVDAPIHLLRATRGPEALPAAEVARWAARSSGGLVISEIDADHAGIIANSGIGAVGAAIMTWFNDRHSLEAL